MHHLYIQVYEENDSWSAISQGDAEEDQVGCAGFGHTPSDALRNLADELENEGYW